jgi:urease gamma subunit
MDGVADMLEKLQVEALFTDGMKLITVYDPIKG